MAHRTVCVSKPSWLKKHLDQLVIEQEGLKIDPIPIEDLAVLVLDSHGIGLTHELLVALTENNAAVVLCDAQHLPCAALVPFTGNALHAKTIREQADCSLPKRKQIWKQVIQAKLLAQARTLAACRGHERSVRAPVAQLRAMAQEVKSGDTDNFEARAAALYFPALFGDEFTRSRELPGYNAALNYGYAVMRAMVARALVGAGMHPALGVFHRGPMNPFNLADDAMEPLRPLVDEAVFRLDLAWLTEMRLPTEARQALLNLTVCTVNLTGKPFGIEPALARYAASWREALCGEGRKLVIPARP